MEGWSVDVYGTMYSGTCFGGGGAASFGQSMRGRAGTPGTRSKDYASGHGQHAPVGGECASLGLWFPVSQLPELDKACTVNCEFDV